MDWETPSENTYAIIVYQNGYTGTVRRRPLGSSPVLSYSGDPIISSSLAFDIECQEEDEMAIFYTNTLGDLKVELQRDDDIIWTGFVTPELYSSSWVDPPYDVHVVATDGLADLKRYDYEPADNDYESPDYSPQESLSYFCQRLGKACGQDFSLRRVSSMKCTDGVSSDFAFNVDKACKGKTWYDALEAVCRIYDAFVMRFNGQFCLIRETDIRGQITDDGAIWVNDHSSLLIDRIGSMRSSTATVWPVGALTMEVEPAKSRIPFKQEPDYLTFSLDLAGDVTYSGSASFNTGQQVSILPAGSLTSSRMTAPVSLPMSGKDYRPAVKLTVRASALSDNCALKGTVKAYGRYLHEDGRLTATSNLLAFSVSRGTTSGDAKDITLIIPSSMPEKFDTTLPLEITFYAEGGTVNIWSISYEEADRLESLESVAEIDNSARGDLSTVELPCLGTLRDDRFVRNSLVSGESYSGTSLIFGSDSIPWCAYNDFMATDMAFRYGLPRLRLKGAISTERMMRPLWLVLENRGVYYRIESMSWRIMEDEEDISILSLPSASVRLGDLEYTTQGKDYDNVSFTPSMLYFGTTGGTQDVIVKGGGNLTPVTYGTLDLSTEYTDYYRSLDITCGRLASGADVETGYVVLGRGVCRVTQSRLTPPSLVTKDGYYGKNEYEYQVGVNTEGMTLARVYSDTPWVSVRIKDDHTFYISLRANSTNRARHGYVSAYLSMDIDGVTTEVCCLEHYITQYGE